MTDRYAGALFAIAGLVGPVHLVAAQEPTWGFGVEVAAARYGGTSIDTSTAAEPSAFRPHNPTVATLLVDRRAGPVRLGLAASYGRSEIGISGGGVLLVTDDLRATVYRLSPQLGVALWRSPRDGAVWLSAGPALEIWNVKPSPKRRTRLGGEAAFWFEQGLTGALAGTVRVTGTLAPSPFFEGELPPEYDRRATWSLALGLGLRFRR